MGKLIRCITSDGAVMASAVDTTDVVAKAEQIHKTSAVVTAAIGRLLTAGSLMGNMLKNKDDSLTLKIDADGPIGQMAVVSDFNGNVRGYVVNPVVEIPLNEKGKLDVSGAVGKNGTLYVIKDIGLKEPYSGSVPLATGEIAEDITAYYAYSEQIPTVCALGVLVNPDLTVRTAGGYIIQLLPGADNAVIDKLEKAVNNAGIVTKMLDSGMSIKEILFDTLKEFSLETVYEQDVKYVCNCNEKRVRKMLMSIDKKELISMADEMPEIKLKCHFCNKEYVFTPDEIRAMAKEKK